MLKSLLKHPAPVRLQAMRFASIFACEAHWEDNDDGGTLDGFDIKCLDDDPDPSFVNLLLSYDPHHSEIPSIELEIVYKPYTQEVHGINTVRIIDRDLASTIYSLPEICRLTGLDAPTVKRISAKGTLRVIMSDGDVVQARHCALEDYARVHGHTFEGLRTSVIDTFRGEETELFADLCGILLNEERLPLLEDIGVA